MDGTLIDTEKLNVRFWIQAGRNMGFDISEDEVLHIRSLDSRLVREYLERNHPGLDFQAVREERRRLMKEHVDSDGLELKPGWEVLLARRDRVVPRVLDVAAFQKHGLHLLEELEAVGSLEVEEHELRLEQVDEGGDLDIVGEIIGYDVKAMGVTADEVAAQNRLTVNVKIYFTNNKYPEDNLEQSFSAYADFDATQSLDAVESSICEEIIDQLVEDIFNATVAQW